MMAVMEGFHHRVAQRLAGMTERRYNNGDWEWLPVDTDLEVIELWSIREKIRMQQGTITE